MVNVIPTPLTAIECKDLEDFLRFARSRTTSARWYERVAEWVQARIHIQIGGSEKIVYIRIKDRDHQRLQNLTTRLEDHGFMKSEEIAYQTLQEYLDQKAAEAQAGGS